MQKAARPAPAKSEGLLGRNVLSECFVPFSGKSLLSRFMREHPGKEHPRGRAAARFSSDARSRPEHVKKPRGPKPAKPQYAKARPGSSPPPLSRKPAPRSAQETRPSAAQTAPAEATESGSRIAKVIARAGTLLAPRGRKLDWRRSRRPERRHLDQSRRQCPTERSHYR